MKRLNFCLLLLFLAGAARAEEEPAAPKLEVQTRTIMGWLESVVVESRKTKMRAKLDTGTKTSSIHAKDIEHIGKGEAPWVRFTLEPGEAEAGQPADEPLMLEKPLARMTRVKQHGGEVDARPVVKLGFCLNGERYESEFTLEDRSGYNYRILLGRDFLKNVALVDPGATFMTRDNVGQCLARKDGAGKDESGTERKKRH
ncbi:MAG TPA: ATP-dependent zinc protease [Methylococcaceae bacterium]|nr:ATP-dependent zinc protease [Methylococcaceae bacterium]